MLIQRCHALPLRMKATFARCRASGCTLPGRGRPDVAGVGRTSNVLAEPHAPGHFAGGPRHAIGAGDSDRTPAPPGQLQVSLVRTASPATAR